MITDVFAFIRENTRISSPPHVPEVKLHLADDAVTLWEMTEEQLEQIGLPPPFWAFAWAGGQALARHILDHREIVAGKTVLDVASGSGLVGIAAMLAGAAEAHCADIDGIAAYAALLNAGLNGVDLTATDADPLRDDPDAEVILVGDLFYDRDIAVRLLAWLRAQSARGCDILVGDPGRSYLPKDDLEQVAEYIVPTTKMLEDAEVKRTGVWRLR